jgi:hypothetical protein
MVINRHYLHIYDDRNRKDEEKVEMVDEQNIPYPKNLLSTHLTQSSICRDDVDFGVHHVPHQHFRLFKAGDINKKAFNLEELLIYSILESKTITDDWRDLETILNVVGLNKCFLST